MCCEINIHYIISTSHLRVKGKELEFIILSVIRLCPEPMSDSTLPHYGGQHVMCIPQASHQHKTPWPCGVSNPGLSDTRLER